jgi:hypothetical protein
MHPAQIVMANYSNGQHCLLAEGDNGAPIYWCVEAPCAISNGKHKKCTKMLGCWAGKAGGIIRCANNICTLNGLKRGGGWGSYSLCYWRTKNKFKKRGWPNSSVRTRLFSSQWTINVALPTENGNTLKKRRWPH